MEMEVICISSDDESDSQKENKTDKPVTKSIETGKDEVFVPAKTETLFNGNEKVDEKHMKRKILPTDKKETNCSTEKKQKLNTGQYTSKVTNKPDICSVPEILLVKTSCNAQPNKSQEVIEKTQLIIKEKKKISYISQDVFPLFISLCLQKCPKNDKTSMDKIINKLKTRYENLDPIYARSENFITFLNEKREAIVNDNKKIYVHIEEVMNEMKKKIRRENPQTLQNEIYDAVPSTSYATNNVPVNKAVESDNDDNADADDDNEEDNIKKAKQIKDIVQAMRKCEAVIKKLEKEEVDFEDEENSNYIKVEHYKRRVVKLYNKLCELTGENADAGRAYLRPKHLNVTQIVAVDQAITNFINSKITKRNQIKSGGQKERALTDDLIFPDYRDILECVKRCNDRKNLQLDKKKQEQIAEKAFKELGEHLQRTRHNDYWDTFSLYLENTEDPATKDINLAQKLADNRTEGEKRLAAVFEKYTQKQEEKDQINEGTTTEEEEDQDEEEEISIINDEDKINNHLPVTSNKNRNNEENVTKIVKENKLPMEKSKPNINMVNACHPVVKTISNKIVPDTLQEKCENTVEIKFLMKEKNTAVSTNENKTISKKTIHKPCSSNIILNKVVKKVMLTNTQEDPLPVASTTNCTKDLPEVKTKVSKVITDPATKKATKDAADAVTRVATKLIIEDIPKVITGNTAKLKGDSVELIEDITEALMETAAEVITNETEIITENVIDGAIENITNGRQPEEEKKKPLLRLRSFAKPPTTWEDNQHKTDKIIQGNTPKVANQIKEIVDLTNEGTSKPSPVVTKCTVQLGNKPVPIVKQRTLLIPSNIINVQNITNNYLKVNPRTGQIIAPVRDVPGSTIIRLPAGTIPTTSRQNQAQNAVIVRNEGSLKGNDVVYRKFILPKNFIVSKKPTVQSVSKQTDVSSSTSKSK